jgi:hypothetical protein
MVDDRELGQKFSRDIKLRNKEPKLEAYFVGMDRLSKTKIVRGIFLEVLFGTGSNPPATFREMGGLQSALVVGRSPVFGASRNIHKSVFAMARLHSRIQDRDLKTGEDGS